MIGSNPCGEIGIQSFSSQERGVAINSLAPCHFDFLQNVRISEDDSRKVHHLCEANGPGLLSNRLMSEDVRVAPDVSRWVAGTQEGIMIKTLRGTFLAD